MSTPSPVTTTADPDTVAPSVIPVQSRSEFFSSDQVALFPAVTGREAQWKLSPVEKLRPLIEGVLDGHRYLVDSTPSTGFSVEWNSTTLVKRGVAGLPEDRLTANAWEQNQEVLLVTIEGEHPEPLRILRDNLGDDAKSGHTIVTVKPGAKATLVMVSKGLANLAETVEFDLGEGSSLQAVFVGQWDSGSIHYASHFAQIGKDASFTHIVVDVGGDVVILNPSVHLVGERSEGHLFGGYFADATQHQEHRVYVNHVGAQTVSRVNYKGALHGKGARTVWVGDVLIGPDAVGTDSYEQNRNLVLSEGTRADSIPNLEIKTGDIKGAGHASATGRFDDEQLFYLQSRGIAELEARRLVVLGFLIEIIQKIDDTELAGELTIVMQEKLTQTEKAS
jgi:Fe-S cluster assembly protein SufD